MTRSWHAEINLVQPLKLRWIKSIKISGTGDTVAANWNALKAKLAADKDAFKAVIARREHDLGVRRAENYAETLENEATCSVDYAIAAIEQAKLAVLDAVAGRIEAEGAKNS